MNCPRFLLSLALSTLLPACSGVDWNLSRCVYELPESCTGVDLQKPVGGVAYVPRGQERETSPAAFVMQVPEVEYTPSTRPVLSGLWAEMERLHAQNVTPTGRLHWVKLEYGVNRKLELLPGLPAGYVRAESVPRLPLAYNGTGENGNPLGVGRLSVSRSAWGPVAAVAAAPLYPVDIALMLVSNTVVSAVELVTFPVVMVGQGVAEKTAEAVEGEKVLLWTEPGVERLPEEAGTKDVLLLR